MKQNRELKKLKRILRKVRSFQEYMERLSDSELQRMTKEFKQRLRGGETLDDLLPAAFAVVCEADRRVLGKFPYDVQVLAGIALHQGYLAEMNTGEGKTLVATMPLYLNALTGKGTMLVTTNEYLALRDSQEMGQVYRFLGLTVAAGVQENPDEQFSNKEKKEIYRSDIVYTTHSILGFDYLLNNLVSSPEDRFMRSFYYVIIDEADSVLLDSAQTPLVISGSPRVQSNLYELADFFVTTLTEGVDYEQEDKKVWLTRQGVRYAESFFGIDNFYGREHFEVNRHVILALRAHVLFEPEKEYMVSDQGEIILLDNDSGRMMPGVKLRGGQHQALETKEKLEISQENRSVASITYQNLFLLFPRMSGMSGTISDAADELQQVYGKKVIPIPPRCPVQRQDFPDLYFRNATEQFDAAIRTALEVHETGQPVLIVTSTIGETEYVSKVLIDERIGHNVLNANNAFWEAHIIQEAGQPNAVTVATSMAGRGTDIKLGEGVRELGGLAVIGIGRMVNVRQERQARGRAGRQGDPGFSRFFVSLEDEIVTENGVDHLERYIEGKKRLSARKLKKMINNAQKTGEEIAVSARKRAMDYDYVLRQQRNLMYETRDSLLDDGGELEPDRVLELARNNIKKFMKAHKKLDQQVLSRYLLENISYGLDQTLPTLKYRRRKDRKQVEQYLIGRVEEGLRHQELMLKTQKSMNDFMRVAALNAIDDAWVEQVDYLQQLQSAVSGRALAQRNLIYEYQKDALESFKEMEETILQNIMRNILLSNVYLDEQKKLHILLP